MLETIIVILCALAAWLADLVHHGRADPHPACGRHHRAARPCDQGTRGLRRAIDDPLGV